MKVLEELVLSATELSLLARMGEVDPLVPVIAPPLDDDAWEAIIAGLLARGLLVPADDETDVRVSDDAVALLGVALLATSATRVARRDADGEVAVTLLRADGAAVHHESLPGGRCRLRPFEADRFPEAAQALLRTSELAGPAGEPVGISLDAFFDRLDAAALDMVGAPSCIRTVEAVDRVDPGDPSSSPRSRLALLVQDAEGLWLARTMPASHADAPGATDGGVVAERVDAESARLGLLALAEVPA